ncbi:MAG: DUF2800 domain-containing protein [Bacteroidales bacterium]|nr:DUF2800 domain-containing protein [Bacteroidales bacterium]
MRHKDRDHALLSASSSHRWLKCPPSAVAAEAYEDEGSEFAAEGTLAHEVAEFIVSNRFDIEAHDNWVSDLRMYLRNPGVTKEMAEHARSYLYYILEQIRDNNAVVLLEQRVDFSEWAPEGFGTCDCIIIQGNTLTIIDYKYGVGVPVSAVDNPQMRLYALGALSAFGFAYDVEKVETHIFQPRINNISTDSLTADELLAWGETVKPIAQMAAEGKGDYKAGEHCKFCPHAGRCRKLTQTCTEYVETHSLRVAVPVLAPHEVAEVLAMEPLVALWLKRVKAQALNSMLDGQEIPGYKLVEGKQGNRKWTDELQVADALKAAGYSQEDYTETKLLSPAAMDKALGKKKTAELLADLVERAAGAPTIAEVTDKRPTYNRLAEAQEDFK